MERHTSSPGVTGKPALASDLTLANRSVLIPALPKKGVGAEIREPASTGPRACAQGVAARLLSNSSESSACLNSATQMRDLHRRIDRDSAGVDSPISTDQALQPTSQTVQE